MIGILSPMDRLVPIPREALADLLRASGSALTPEAYVASLGSVDLYRRYGSRATVSAWSKYTLLLATVLSVLLLPVLFSIEAVIIVGLLAGVTFFEFRANRYFRERHPEAPALGFRNQSVFAAIILIYGLYHAIVVFAMPMPVEYNNLVDPEILKAMERVSYLIIGVVGGLSQFGLAWYYRTARVREKA